MMGFLREESPKQVRIKYIAFVIAVIGIWVTVQVGS